MVFAMIALVGLILGIVLHMAVIDPVDSQIRARRKAKIVTPSDKIKELEADLDSKSIYAMIREGEEKVSSISEKWNEDLPVLVSTPIVDEDATVSGRTYIVRRAGDKAYILDNGWIEREPIFKPYMNIGPGYSRKLDAGAVARIYHKETYPPEEFIKLGEPVELDRVEELRAALTSFHDKQDSLKQFVDNEEVIVDYSSGQKFSIGGIELDGDYSDETVTPCHIVQGYITLMQKKCPHYGLEYGVRDPRKRSCHNFLPNGSAIFSVDCVHIGKASIQVVNEKFRGSVHKGYVLQELAIAQRNNMTSAVIRLESGEAVIYVKIRDGVWEKIAS